MVASGAAWESAAFGLLTGQPGVVVLKRCVDVNELLAAATAGQADVAVVGLESHGLDAAAVEHLRRHRVRTVAVVAGLDDTASARAARVGVTTLITQDDLARLAEAVLHPTQEPAPGSGVERPTDAVEAVPDQESPGRVVAVWGPGGAPGRTTVALALAAVLAHRNLPALVVDADPYGGAVAQHLGIMDEVSGLLSCARWSAAGDLEGRFPAAQRKVSDRLHVITGLPRPDRWTEVRPGAIEHVLEIASAGSHVIVDTGFSLETEPMTDFSTVPGRNSMTLGGLAAADEIVVVGAADPVGLSRLARGLVELKEVTRGGPVRVVINRMRSSLGWSEADIAGMVTGFSRVSGLHFLPDDRIGVDRALIAGRTLVEAGDSALVRAVEAVAGALFADLAPTRPQERRLRLRRAGRDPRS
ncbi:AAA family ATPase [Nocardioides sp.]|uniref:AAA family ATPase n=1 Tax=Nocardioides sp. TaxID=35761 RepID=UPI003D13AACF